MSIVLEREVVVVSNDGEVHREITEAVERHPGARTLRIGGGGLGPGPRDRRIVVIDDTGEGDALALLQRIKAGPHDVPVVYLASAHSTALESAVRQAGASFYCVKAQRDGQLTRVIDALLGQRER